MHRASSPEKRKMHDPEDLQIPKSRRLLLAPFNFNRKRRGLHSLRNRGLREQLSDDAA